MDGHVVKTTSVSSLPSNVRSQQDNSPRPSQAQTFSRDVTCATDDRIPCKRPQLAADSQVDTPVAQREITSTSPQPPEPVTAAQQSGDELDKHLAIARTVIAKNDPKYLKDISAQSWANIAQGLKFAGVDTYELADKMNLRVCPPSTVINTWAALHGTTIFDGINNPKGYEHLNYVPLNRSARHSACGLEPPPVNCVFQTVISPLSRSKKCTVTLPPTTIFSVSAWSLSWG